MNLGQHTILNFWCSFSGKDCGFPGRPGNGTTIGAEKFFYPGEEVTFQCDNGFILFGGDRRICQEDGSWSGSLPECSKIHTFAPLTLTFPPQKQGEGRISTNWKFGLLSNWVKATGLRTLKERSDYVLKTLKGWRTLKWFPNLVGFLNVSVLKIMILSERVTHNCWLQRLPSIGPFEISRISLSFILF